MSECYPSVVVDARRNKAQFDRIGERRATGTSRQGGRAVVPASTGIIEANTRITLFNGIRDQRSESTRVHTWYQVPGFAIPPT